MPAESYAVANKRLAWETIPPLLDRASPHRTSHLRDPVGPQIHLASESFIDEVAAAVNADPIEFRLRYIKEPSDIAVIKATAEKPTGTRGLRHAGTRQELTYPAGVSLMLSATGPALR